MAGSDWASALGAAMQQFGSSYGRYAEQKHDQMRQKALLDQALARDAFEMQQYADLQKRQAAQDKRQEMMDERAALEQFRESAPFEAALTPEMEGRFQKAGMGDWIGQRPATQTNIPSQFLMPGGEAETTSPGSFLRPSLQQQAAQQALRVNDPLVRRQQALEDAARENAEWTRRNNIQAKQQEALARIRETPALPRDPFGNIFANALPGALAQGMSPQDLARSIRAALSQGVGPQAFAPTGSGALDQHLADLDSDLSRAGSAQQYARDVKAAVEAGELDQADAEILIRAAAGRANQRRTDISLP